MDLSDAILSHFSQVIYLHIQRDRILCKSISKGIKFDSLAPGMVLDADKMRAAFGNGRLFLADGTACQDLLAPILIKLCGRRALVKPAVVLHMEDIWKDEITEGEILYIFRVLRSSGSRRSWVWIGRELTDQELLTRNFPKEGCLYSDTEHRFLN